MSGSIIFGNFFIFFSKPKKSLNLSLKNSIKLRISSDILLKSALIINKKNASQSNYCTLTIMIVQITGILYHHIS